MSPTGARKINKLMMLDYVDGKPRPTLRLEIDISLDNAKSYNTLKKLLDAKQSPKGDREIVKRLLARVGTAPNTASAKEKAQNKAARHFVAAAFDLEPEA